jgi:hypothetical protein
MTFFDVFFVFMDSVKYQHQASMNHLFRMRNANKVPAPLTTRAVGVQIRTRTGGGMKSYSIKYQ